MVSGAVIWTMSGEKDEKASPFGKKSLVENDLPVGPP